MHLKKVAQLLFRSMHFANELAEFYLSYNGGYWPGTLCWLAEFYMAMQIVLSEFPAIVLSECSSRL